MDRLKLLHLLVTVAVYSMCAKLGFLKFKKKNGKIKINHFRFYKRI